MLHDKSRYIACTVSKQVLSTQVPEWVEFLCIFFYFWLTFGGKIEIFKYIQMSIFLLKLINAARNKRYL